MTTLRLKEDGVWIPDAWPKKKKARKGRKKKNWKRGLSMWNQVDQRIRSALRGIRLAFRGRLTRVKSDLSIQQVQVNGLAA